eukprot:scaffold120613_cov33-Tisochrysis_lutea.AAC.1
MGPTYSPMIDSRAAFTAARAYRRRYHHKEMEETPMATGSLDVLCARDSVRGCQQTLTALSTTAAWTSVPSPASHGHQRQAKTPATPPASACRRRRPRAWSESTAPCQTRQEVASIAPSANGALRLWAGLAFTPALLTARAADAMSQPLQKHRSAPASGGSSREPSGGAIGRRTARRLRASSGLSSLGRRQTFLVVLV